MSDSPLPPRRRYRLQHDPGWVDFMAHEVVGLLPRGIPQSIRLPIIRDFLDKAERIFLEEGVAVPPWVQRARELYLGDEVEG